ncbi:MAG: peptidylprolyl isomerase [Chlamydiia bacterium]
MRTILTALCTLACAASVHAQGEPLSTSEQRIQMTTIVEMITNQGPIQLELYEKAAPKACQNFCKLAEQGYYNGITFHRVIKNFMAQGGDPTGTGAGGKSIFGKSFEDECVPELRFDQAGILAMANAGPNTNGSQFFITFAPCAWLNGRHTIFGKVKTGMETLKKIEAAKTGPQDRPVEPIVIKEMHVQKAKAPVQGASV